MPLPKEELLKRINQAVLPGFSSNLVSRGLARSLLWNDGVLPPGAPEYSPALSSELQSYGVRLLHLCLELRDHEKDNPAIAPALERAAEAMESVVRRGALGVPETDFLRILSASSYHLGHFSARAFSVFAGAFTDLNLNQAERALVFLFLRDFKALNALFDEHSQGGFDIALARSLAAEPTPDCDEALQRILNAALLRSLSVFLAALETGDSGLHLQAVEMLKEGTLLTHEFQHPTFWLIFTITRHLLDDLWGNSLHVCLPDLPDAPENAAWFDLRRFFIALLSKRSHSEIDLWPSQLEAAARALNHSDDLVVSLPTSSGKTKIAELCILRALSLNLRIVFVTPLRALSAQTERTLRKTFSPLGFSVSSLYGSSGVTGDDRDSLSNRNIVVSTPEKLDFALRNNPEILEGVGLVVLDEGHSIGTQEREVRYEVLVQRLLQRADADSRRIVCLSAILPGGEELDDFVAWLRSDEPGSPVRCDWRATRQRFGRITWHTDRARIGFEVGEEKPFVPSFFVAQPPKGRRGNPFPQNAQEFTLASAWKFVEQGQTVLIFCPLKVSVEPLAEMALLLNRQGYLNPVLRGNEAHIRDAVVIGSEWLGASHPAVRCLSLGVAVHHGSLPKPFQREVERLLREGVLTVTIASPTLAQGLNLNATTLLLHSLYRNRSVIPAEEFFNVAGRAGRAFIDVEGQVICVDFENAYAGRWNTLVRAGINRNVRSGILRLVISLHGKFANRGIISPAQLLEYLTGNADAWNPPPSIPGDNGLPEQWMKELEHLDLAILALIPHETPEQDIAVVLDQTLSGSLWQRSLARCGESTLLIAPLILRSRAQFVWLHSTPLQRKAAFSAGLSFTSGQLLEAHAPQLTALLIHSDSEFAAGQTEAAIEHTLEFADIAFGIPPFKVELPQTWRRLAEEWLKGKNLSDFAGNVEREIVDFLEGALVYRLVWALESIRVRAIAVGEAGEDAFNGRTALAVETGTPDQSASLLIHAGFGSRVAAIKAISDTNASFTDHRGMKRWVYSDKVVSLAAASDWPTPETASLWRKFIAGFNTADNSKWSAIQFRSTVDWLKPPSPGLRVMVRGGRYIESADREPLGILKEPLSFSDSGIFDARISPDCSGIEGKWIGPTVH